MQTQPIAESLATDAPPERGVAPPSAAILESSAARRIAIGLAVGFVLLELVASTGVAAPPHLALLQPSQFQAGAWTGSFVLLLASSPLAPRRRLVGLASLASLVLWALLVVFDADRSATHVAVHAGTALGLAAAGAAAVEVATSRVRAWSTVVAVAALPVFVALTATGLHLTVALHPITRDGAAYRLDAVLAGAVSFVIGRVGAASNVVVLPCAIVYVALPTFIAVIHAIERRAAHRARVDTLTACFAVGLGGFALYHLCPVAGPGYVFGDHFPNDPPDAARVPLEALLTNLAPRNGVPSLHTAWALLLVLRAWTVGRAPRAAALAWLGVTLLATFVLGEHYLVDLVIAVPFACAIDAAVTTEVPIRDRIRWLPIATGAGLLGAWIAILRWAGPELGAAAWGLRLLAVVTVVAPLTLARRLVSARLRATPPAPAVASSPPPLTQPRGRAPDMLAFVTGFAGLLGYDVARRAFGATFGTIPTTSFVVAVATFAGIAIGLLFGGRVFAKLVDLPRVAFAALAAGIWYAASPLWTGWVQSAYVGLASDNAPANTALELVLVALALLPATAALGATLAPLVRIGVAAGHADAGHALARLSAATAFGAATSAVLGGYRVTPFVGISITGWLVVLVHLGLAFAALRLARRPRKAPGASAEGTRSAHPVVASVIVVGGGAATFALAVVQAHLLAFVVGTDTYAVTRVSIAFLVAFGGGAALGARLLRLRPASLAVASGATACLALAALLGVFAWDAFPGYFAAFESFPITRTFGAREFVRLCVCVVAIAPSALAAGAIHSVALAVAARHEAASLERSAARYVAGGAVGALAAFVLIPRTGALHALHLVAAFALVLALVPVVARAIPGDPRTVAGRAAGLVLACVLLFLASPRVFDLGALGSSAASYFAPSRYGVPVDGAASAFGEIATVVSTPDATGREVKTLLANGEPEGDDWTGPEAVARDTLALLPLLHTTRRERALVVGFGVGSTARTLRDAGFAAIDIVEPVADVLTLAARHFARAGADVLADPAVHAAAGDARGHLSVHSRAYELITLDAPSLSAIGASSLYDREFYALAKQRLTPDGVLEQRVQLDRIGSEQLVRVLGTLRTEFPAVRLYAAEGRALLVACLLDCSPRPETIALLDAAPRLARVLAASSGGAKDLLGRLVLAPPNFDQAILAGAFGVDPALLVSTDDNLLVAFAVPRGNAMQPGVALKKNIEFLSKASRGQQRP